ncbi:MAG: OadG family protein [Candidatus Rokubacteria bacterium]|nr:OadG family protein [Candidatus Rokubacteria bacterium]
MRAKRCRGFALLVLACLIVTPSPGLAAFGDDTEKPAPEFTRKGEVVTATLIPRAKSTSVDIDVRVSGGTLDEVRAYDFENARRPEVDIKDYKSGLFEIRIRDVNTSGEARLSMTSSFFTSGTELWIFNPKRPSAWMKVDAVETISHPGGAYELAVRAADGGDFDADGAADGRMTVIAGPRDSFWGYALGTLFIRFAGIFVVLAILMIGMVLAGRVFQVMERRGVTAAPAPPPPETVREARATGTPAEVEPELAAAIAGALHLYFRSMRPDTVDLGVPDGSAWAQSGRMKIMEERFLVFNRRAR